jgi:hypothetical protein
MARRYRLRPFISGSAAVMVVAFGFRDARTATVEANTTLGSSISADQVADTDWSDRVPAHIAVIDGTAWLDRDGQTDAVDENTPLLAGDRLRTDRGRVEVLFADGSALDLDERSSVTVLSETLLRLDAGRMHLTVARGSGPADYRVDAAGTTTLVRMAGQYHVSLNSLDRTAPTVTLEVVRGSAEFGTAYGRTVLRAGDETSATSRTEPSPPMATFATTWDAFDRWAQDRAEDRLGGPSTRYLPTELAAYSGAFDHYGAWQYDESSGYVWYPRVDAGWRPYYQGQWSFVGSYGWFWVGAGRWAWPTHHYGRWGLNGAAWYWIPDRRWAPAWVSWADAPGYLGWCPLGYDNRPIVAFNVGYGSYGGFGRGWTTVAVHQGPRIPVDGRTRLGALPSGARFVERRPTPMPALPGGARADAQPSRAYAPQAGYGQPRTPNRGPAAQTNGPARGAAPRGGPATHVGPNTLAERPPIASPNGRGLAAPGPHATTPRRDPIPRSSADSLHRADGQWPSMGPPSVARPLTSPSSRSNAPAAPRGNGTPQAPRESPRAGPPAPYPESAPRGSTPRNEAPHVSGGRSGPASPPPPAGGHARGR